VVLLSAREREVLCLLANDLSLKEVANHLQLSLHTVDNHTRKIYNKLGVGSRLEAILRAQALGLLDLK
jgi:ATP/maltotriose-dependent transcriptional regulator MalT